MSYSAWHFEQKANALEAERDRLAAENRLLRALLWAMEGQNRWCIEKRAFDCGMTMYLSDGLRSWRIDGGRELPADVAARLVRDWEAATHG